MKSLTEYDNNEIIFDLNDISSFLYSTGYLNRQKYNNAKKQQKNQEDNPIILEKNINISIVDASDKYGELLSKINKLFDTNLSFEDNYLQYKIYTKSDINFVTYLNYLIIFIYIINNYSDLLNINSLLNISKEKVSIIEKDSINNYQQNTLTNDLEKLYKNIKDNHIYKDKEINENLIILLFFISINNTIIIDSEINSINSFISNYSLFNKIYVSNIDLGLMLYIESIIFINRYAITNNEEILNINNNNSNKIFNKVNQINSDSNDNTTRNKRKIKIEIFGKLKKPFTSRTTIETSKNIKNEIGEITMTDVLSNNNNLIINNNNNENNYLNDKSNIPNLYLFDNETIKFPYKP